MSVCWRERGGGDIFEKLLPFSLMGKLLSRNLHRADIPEDVNLAADVRSARGGGVSSGEYSPGEM